MLVIYLSSLEILFCRKVLFSHTKLNHLKLKIVEKKRKQGK